MFAKVLLKAFGIGQEFVSNPGNKLELAKSKWFRGRTLSQLSREERSVQKTALLTLALMLAVIALPAQASCSDRRSSGVDWSGCKKTHKMLNQQDFSNAKFDGADMSSSRLDDSDFTGSSLIKTDLTRSNVKHSHFERVNLSKSIGYHTDFSASRFVGTLMTKSEFSRASFKNTVFQRVDWSRAELGRAEFRGAKLEDVMFEYTNLSRVRFTGATLQRVDFKGAYTFLTRFEDVNLKNTTNLTQEQLNLACGNNETVLPQYLKKPPAWPCED